MSEQIWKRNWEWIKYLEEGEECKELKEHPGSFITNRGRVWSMKKYRFLSIKPHHKYYYKVCVGEKTYHIHRLVGRNFLPEYEEGLFILHKEETLPFPEIHYVENLWVGTQGDNMRDRSIKKRNNNTNRKLTEQQVREIRTLSATTNITKVKLGEIYGVSRDIISKCVREESYREYL